jgi:hypothetical protein
MKKRVVLVFLLIFILIFNSCIGVSMDLEMRKDGSGKINMEYRIYGMAESIGRLDGNQNWPIIPSGREDMERTVARIDGMKLVSYSSRESEIDKYINVVLEYENPEALLKFLNPTGTDNVSLNRSDQSGKLEFVLSDSNTPSINTDLLALAKQVFTGYKFSISLSAERNSTLTLTDGRGREITLPAEIVSSGRKTSLSMEMPDLLSLNNGLAVRFEW